MAVFVLLANGLAATVSNPTDADLRAAIATGGTVDFAPALSGATITLTGELLISNNVTVDATSLPAGLTISGGGSHRIFSVAAGGNITLRGLTLRSGNATGAVLNGEGGAVYNLGVAALERCTLSGNSATGHGGAIRNDGTLVLSQCTLSGNTSGDTGGAIANFGTGPLTLTHCTIASNTSVNNGGGLMISAGIATLQNSIVSGNTAAAGADIWSEGPAGGLTRVGANIIGSAGKIDSAPDNGPDAISANPLLGPLADNGGPTQTMALLAYSQAIDGVPLSATVAGLGTDQRGFARSLGSGPDLGAYESGDSNFTATGLSLHARVPLAQINAGGFLEIHTDSTFTVTNPTVRTLAGAAGADGYLDGTRLSARFDYPSGVGQDSLGNIFIADTVNNLIRVLDPEGVVSTIAGTGAYGKGNGPGLSAALAFPSAITVGPDDNVYFSDTFNHRICKLTRPPAPGQQWTVSTLAGTGTAGYLNGAGTVARFNYPYGLQLDASGNVYVADALNHRIRKITPAGTVSTFAGAVSGGSNVAGVANDAAAVAATAAAFDTPQGIVISGGIVFVADAGNNRIRKITTVPGVAGFDAVEVTTLAGSGGEFTSPSSVVVSTDGTILYVGDEMNNRIRRVTLTPSVVVSTVAGSDLGTAGSADGIFSDARFNAPTGLLLARDSTLVVADSNNHTLRSVAVGPIRVIPVADLGDIDASGGVQVNATLNLELLGLSPGVTYHFRYRISETSTVILGQGQTFTQVELPTLSTVAADRLTPTAGRLRATVDPNNLPTSAVFEYSTEPDMQAPLIVSKLAGSNIPGFADSPNALFSAPEGLAVSGGSVFVADFQNHRIRKIDTSGDVSTFAGTGIAGFLDGAANTARFDRPSAIVAEPDVVLADCETVFGSPVVSCASTAGLAVGAGIRGRNIADRTTIVSITDATHFVVSNNATGTSEGLSLIAGGANFYVADEFNHCIRKITASGVVTVFAGTASVAGFADGPVGTALFLYPSGVALDSAIPPNVYVADKGNHCIRKVAPDGSVTTFAGAGVSGFANGIIETAQFASPRSVAVNADGAVLVADTGNHVIRKISGGSVITFAGSTQGFLDGPDVSAQFDTPSGIAMGADGVAFVTDSGNHRIRQIAPDGAVSTYAGSGIAGAVNSPALGLYPASATQFNAPSGIAVDNTGAVFVTQQAVVRKIARGAVPTIAWPPVLTGTTAQNIAADVSGLLPGLTYYFRAKGTCLQATITGDILAFSTPFASITVNAGPDIASPEVMSAQTAPVDFGATTRGTPVVRQFTIANPSGRNLRVTAINAPTGYAVTSGGGLHNIAPGDTLTFDVTLLATNPGTIAGNVIISSDATGLGTFIIPVTGVVQAPPAVTTLTATGVSDGDATLNATVNPFGSGTDVWFQWSLTGQFDGVDVDTLAGSSPGDADGSLLAARFNKPSALATDAFGNVFVADTQNHRIRKISFTDDGSGNLTGSVVSFAGSGVAGFADGPGASAQFDHPSGLAIGADGTVYVADSGNHLIRAITAGGEVRTYSGSLLREASFTDGVGTAARFSTPRGLAIDQNGTLYVADQNNHRIRKVATDGSVSTLAGSGTAGTLDGAGAAAQFSQPQAIAVNAAGFVYVTEATSHAIRRIEANGATSTFAGSVASSGFANGNNAAARFSSPAGLSVSAGGTLYVADAGNHAIRTVTSAVDGSGVVTSAVGTFAGLGTPGATDGLKNVAQFDTPISVLVTGDAKVYVGEQTQATIRRLVPTEPLLPAASGLTGTSALPVALDVSNLTIGTTYFYRVVASNVHGTSYGSAFSIRAGTPFQIWQFEKFGIDADNPLISGPDVVLAGDGVTNLVKYALGLEPYANAAGSLPVASISGGMLSLAYAKVLTATDSLYTVEWSTNLVAWNTTGITDQVFPPIGNTQFVIAMIPVTPGQPKFLRLKITFR